MISQLSIFMQNEKGRLSAATHTLAEAGINMQSLNIADTSEYGVARILCDTPKKAVEVLSNAGYRARIAKLAAVRLPHEPGSLATLLDKLDAAGINIEYGYCFSIDGKFATYIFKTDDEAVESILTEAGYQCVAPEEIYVEG